METISCLKNSRQGSDIYVIASGKSSQYIDPSFFEGKITIGVNFVYNTFPDLTYYVCKENYVSEFLSERGKTIIVSEYDCGNTLSTKNTQGTFFFRHAHNSHLEFDETLDTVDSLIVSWSTITSAIHFAYFLGAKNIILLGHDCGELDADTHLNGYVKGAAYQDGWLQKIEPQTLRLKELLKEKGVNLYSLNPFINFGLEGHTYTRNI